MEAKDNVVRLDRLEPVRNARRRYASPMLVNLGRVAELTQGPSGVLGDGNSGQATGKHG